MTDDDTRPASSDALALVHEKLDSALDEQVAQSEHLDRKAMGTLQAAFGFSSVVAAVAYYASREQPRAATGPADAPFTYLALVLGTSSVLLAFGALYHTKLTTDIEPMDAIRHASHDRTALLVTLVESYAVYVARNDARLDTDRALLSLAQVCLVVAIVVTVIAVGLYVGRL